MIIPKLFELKVDLCIKVVTIIKITTVDEIISTLTPKIFENTKIQRWF